MKKLRVLILLFVITLFAITTKIQATSQKIEILKKSDTEYIIYLENNVQTEFEFAFSNNEKANKEKLIYKACGKDNNTQNANSIIYIDLNLYNKYFSNEVYLWVRNLKGEYLIQNLKIDLNSAVEEDDFNRINNITKIIKVETQNSVVTKYVEDEVEVSKTVGKVDVLEDGVTYYKLIKLPDAYECNKLMELVNEIENNKTNINMYSKLKLVRQFKQLYDKSTKNGWQLTKDNVILEPEDSKDGEQYILFLKNKKQDGTIKLDAQFLTCFEEYNEKYINEKISVKLPITSDNPILYIILTILLVFFILLIIFKIINKKTKGNL